MRAGPMRGRSYELLFGALRAGTVGQELSAEARGRLLDFLSRNAGIDADSGRYTGHDRRTPGEAPPDLVTLLESGFACKLRFFEEFDLQATMLQVVGGTDRLTDAFASRLKSPLHLGRAVRGIMVSDSDVRIVTDDGELRADRCVVTLPLPVLAKIEHNLSAEFRDAVEGAAYEPAVKVGLETESRWWESDLSVYGGMTFTDHPATQFWYPSSGFGADRGVLLGAYNFSDHGVAYSDLPPDERVAAATKDVEEVHSRPAEVRSGISVAWRNQPWAGGAYANEDHSKCAVLAAPHPRVRLAGEHMSANHGWITGALESGAAAAEWALDPA